MDENILKPLCQMSLVPDEPIIENIGFVDEGKIDVVLSTPNNPPSDYCIQFKSGGDDVLIDYFKQIILDNLACMFCNILIANTY